MEQTDQTDQRDQIFTLLPLTLDPSTKALSSPLPELEPLVNQVNTLHRALVPLPSQTPPPPLPTNPKRTAQIQKMRDQGNNALRRSATAASAQEAIKLYTYALEMALGRPGWEPANLVREEASGLFANRAQAYMTAAMWPEGAADAQCSVEMKRGPGNGKAWWRRGKCLVEMGRWAEAREWVQEGLRDDANNEAELGALARDIERYFAEAK